jgi:N-acetylmuramoyl-L-alanine amidase
LTAQPGAGVGQANPTLRRGSDGESVIRLHAELRDAGLPIQGDAPDHFGAATEETVRAFQRRRRLQVDGICGPDTWSALHEDPLALGDRLISLRRPMLRGDDVRQLQQQLSAIGFDAGRIDGIFGPHTDKALRDFQRNAAVAVDGICGRDTIAAMVRVGGLADGEISELRERESFAASPRALPGRHVLLASRMPGAAPAVTAIAEDLERRGARCSQAIDLAIDTDAARAANDLDVDLCVVVQPVADPAWHCAYYRSGRYRSFRGHAIALRVAEQLSQSTPPERVAALTAGLSGGVLRETRMPAVVVQLELEPLDVLARGCAEVADGIRLGFEAPPELPAG